MYISEVENVTMSIYCERKTQPTFFSRSNSEASAAIASFSFADWATSTGDDGVDGLGSPEAWPAWPAPVQAEKMAGWWGVEHG